MSPYFPLSEMCGIVSAYLSDPSQEQIDTVKRLFYETQIRGMHQTGMTFLRDSELIRFVVQGNGEKFVNEFNWGDLTSLDRVVFIGHNRYSTSDLNYPQPIQVFDDFALVHNGVVTQEPPSLWKKYGYELLTANDSELLYQSRYQGREPLKEFPGATMAVCELTSSGEFRWYRNGGRPLYYVKVENGYFICSTLDIAIRSGLENPQRCKPGVVYTPSGSTTITEAEELIV